MDEGEVANWSALAEGLAQELPLSRCHPDACVQLSQAVGQRPWSIACSGGVDSLALLLLIWGHFPEMRTQMQVLHYHHGLRGKEADLDEAFVREVATALGCAIHTEKRAVRSEEEKPNEAQLREARLSFYEKWMQKTASIVLLLGHHKNDIAETLLMRLARGSGLGGLIAPRPVQVMSDGVTRLRPLLTLSKVEIEACMKACDIVWREDKSNETDDYFRNRVRHHVVPAWEEASSSKLLDNVAYARDLMEEDDQALEACLDIWMPAWLKEGGLDLNELQAKPHAFLRRAIHRCLIQEDKVGLLSRAAFEHLLAAAREPHATTKMSLGEDGFICVCDNRLSFSSRKIIHTWSPVKLTPSSIVFLPNGFRILLEFVTLTDTLRGSILSGACDNRNEVYLERRPEEGILLWIRPWQAGDRYRPLGSTGSRKLQDMFTDKKIDRWVRRSLPVVCSERDGVLWCPGLPPAESQKITSTSTRALRLTYELVM